MRRLLALSLLVAVLAAAAPAVALQIPSDPRDLLLEPFTGATGKPTTLQDTVFSTIPGSPAFPGRASQFKRKASAYGMADIDVSGRNAVQGDFHFAA